jgi:hypothetical protein
VNPHPLSQTDFPIPIPVSEYYSSSKRSTFLPLIISLEFPLLFSIQVMPRLVAKTSQTFVGLMYWWVDVLLAIGRGLIQGQPGLGFRGVLG